MERTYFCERTVCVQDRVNTKKLAKIIKKSKKNISSQYKKTMHKKSKSTYTEWLCDNAYLLLREADELIALLKNIQPLPSGENGLPRIYHECRRIYDSSKTLDTKTLLSELSEASLTGNETEVLSVILKSVIIASVSKSLADKKDSTVIAKAVKTLRRLPDIDFKKINREISPTEKQLLKDPSGTYPLMDDESKAMYRAFLTKESGKKGIDSEKMAHEIIEKAKKGTNNTERHIGSYILPKYKRAKGYVFLTLEILVSLCIAVLFGVYTRWYTGALIFLPVYSMVSAVLVGISQKGTPPRRLPGIEIKEIPTEAMTLITVSSLLPSTGKIDEMKEHLRQLYLSNGGKNVKVCLLADMKNSGTPERPEDEKNIKMCKRMIKELNEKYGEGFILAIRPRVYAPTEGYFSGWERKRGAITQLVREIKGESGGFICLFGDTGSLCEVKYLMALDSDTVLPFDSMRRLVSAALHPLNQPYVDKEKGAVTKGYGVLAPRVCADISSAKTPFSRIMCGEVGISSYSNTVSERYQDLFGEGIFSGKGLITVDAFYEVLNDSLPEGRILSHDILEGGYLRCGFVSDVGVSDGYPKNQSVYFDRQSRWIRGDWQNIPFIFSKNPLNALSRFKLFDNLRRSLTPVMILMLLVVSVFLPQKEATALSLICIFSAASGNFLTALKSLFHGGIPMISRLFYSDLLPSSLGSFFRGVVMIFMLPLNGIKSAVSVCLALWRRFVSKKRLLDWTTFAQSGKNATKRKIFIDCLLTAGTASVLFVSENPVLKLCAVLFFGGIPFLLLSGKEKTETERISWLDKDYLLSAEAAMWKFFEENCDEKNNFLPPDNVQETPVYKVAHRTSPTNIGLFLLCTLAARDFGFTDSKELYERLKKSLDSVKKLKTYRGNLLNWYNTETLEPLRPEYVSTVDCGNFLCCLTALKEGLSEYENEEPRLREIKSDIEVLEKNADMRIFYNEQRDLFHIGIEADTGKLSDSYYDLFMSESRMTSYYTIAKREVPKKHWAALSRTMSRNGRFTGPVSWTGTMFEYFMPYIFLPSEKGTLGFEALKYCSWCQRKRVSGIPFGMSESGFYAFDRDFNYQYKAHGVGALGLRRGLDSETVISPYSSFLLLPLEHDNAIRNLHRLEKMGMTGRWGFFEAIDFTPSHTNGRKYAVVRSYMAHHVGMSMLSVSNALKNGIMRERFMRDRQMKSAESLLYEGIPADAYVFRSAEREDVRTVRERTDFAKREIRGITPLFPTVKAVTNGELTLVMSDTGASVSFYRGVCLLKHSKDLLRYPQGVIIAVNDENMSLCATRFPQYEKGNHKCTFSGSDIIHSSSKDGIAIKVRTSVHPTDSCEQRVITVKNSRKKAFDGTLRIYAEPSLDSFASQQSHMAFSKLFITEKHDKKSGITVYGKKDRNSGHGIFLAAGFLEDTDFVCERSKLNILQNGYDRDSLFDPQTKFSDSNGNTDCCFAAEIKLHIPPKGTVQHTFLLSAASSAVEASDKIFKTRKNGGIRERKGAKELFSEGSVESVLTRKMLPSVVFGVHDGKRNVKLPLKTLWRFSISGDNPIIYAHVKEKEDVSKIAPCIRAVERLRSAGIMCDLAIAYEEGGDYASPVLTAIKDAVKRENGMENCAECGVYPVNLKQFSKEEAQFLREISTFDFDSIFNTVTSEKQCFEKALINDTKTEKFVKQYTFTDDGISISKTHKNPYLPWCLTISNKNFGTMVSVKSLGFTWAVNSRENKLTPWYNDPSFDNRGELLLASFDGKIYDVIRNSDTHFEPGIACWSGNVGNVNFKTKVTVGKRALCKKITVTAVNNGDADARFDLLYYAEPVLGVSRDKSRFMRVERHAEGFVFSSPVSEMCGYGALRLKGGADILMTSRASVLEGNFSSVSGETEDCTAVGRKIFLRKGEKTELLFTLSWGKSRDSVLLMPEIGSENKTNTYISVKTAHPDMDRMVNTWLLWQIRSCRIESRTGFYQCGGAWGFRDQLQDVSSLIITDPDRAKIQIARCAAVQFKEGDVLHWWHALPYASGGIKGVRTKYSDDLLWLPLVTSDYVKITGDSGFLHTEIPYIEGELLFDGENERYFSPTRSHEKAPLIEHCLKAVERSLNTGIHGLSLIGSGDWNDGYNNIGPGGKGESVWLSMFLIIVLERMKELCALCNIEERCKNYDEIMASLKESIDKNAWDGDRYIRAYTDDGIAIGKKDEKEPKECQIDSLPQSFSVFSGMPDKERVKKALKTATDELVDKEKGIIKLLSPPFTGKGKQIGYITAYPEGIRENGGQYTHAAVWLCAALIMNGETEKGYELLRMINPSYFCENEEKMRRYGAEPYALAGDVPLSKSEKGCTGWSLYTGSASWYYRTLVELVFGLRFEGKKLYVKPSAPKAVYPIEIKLYKDFSHISIKSAGLEGKRLFVDGKEAEFIPLDGKNHVAELKI